MQLHVRDGVFPEWRRLEMDKRGAFTSRRPMRTTLPSGLKGCGGGILVVLRSRVVGVGFESQLNERKISSINKL